MNVETTCVYRIRSNPDYQFEITLNNGLVQITYLGDGSEPLADPTLFDAEEAEAIAEAILALIREARR